jgi:hypothetical protein
MLGCLFGAGHVLEALQECFGEAWGAPDIILEVFWDAQNLEKLRRIMVQKRLVFRHVFLSIFK